MAVPYQCLVAQNSTSDTKWILFAASGSKIIVQSSRKTTTIWPEQDTLSKDHQDDDESEERPGKRIKLEQPKEQKPNFSHLILSRDWRYLIGVTGEDKCIRVFQVDPHGRLQQLSERCMSRRPSSITITSDDSTILCGDKFGDVYALPLLPSPDDEKPERSETPAIEQPEPKDWTPSATTLTVHSGRNRKTLEEQLKQKAKGPAKSKEPMRFKHELLLGHVAMLTDVIYTTWKGQSYIITADRDEHIRISRGQPQAHIIEGFCFGHEAFINKLCLTNSGLLVSGGGDDHLFVWDWLSYRLLEKLPIRDLVWNYLVSRSEPNESRTDNANFKVAVSGIWNVPKSDMILVACEGVPALFSLSTGDGAKTAETIPLKGNVLGVALVETTTGETTIVVSIDNIHKPGSTTEVRDDKVPRLQNLAATKDGQWGENPDIAEALQNLEGVDAVGVNTNLPDEKAVREMLYNVENLRKRPGAED